MTDAKPVDVGMRWTIELRAGVRILQWDNDRGCRPATEPECEAYDALLALQAEVAQIKAQDISDLDRMTATRVRLDNEVATLRHSLGYVRLTLDEAVPGMDEGAPIEAIARKVKAEVARLTQENARLKDVLKDANDACRSAYQVASRGGKETDFEAWKFALQKSLRKQHEVMYPEQYIEERLVRIKEARRDE